MTEQSIVIVTTKNEANLVKDRHHNISIKVDDIQQGKTILMHLGTAFVSNVLERFVGLVWQWL